MTIKDFSFSDTGLLPSGAKLSSLFS